MTLKKSSLVVAPTKDGGGGEPTTPHQLEGCGIVIGSLLLVPGSDWTTWRKEVTSQRGPNTVFIHPQFPLREMEYLRCLTFVSIRRRIEGLLQFLDRCRVLDVARCEALMGEVAWLKEVVASNWPDEASEEVKRVNDLADVLTSRLIELPKIQVLEAVKIED